MLFSYLSSVDILNDGHCINRNSGATCVTIFLRRNSWNRSGYPWEPPRCCIDTRTDSQILCIRPCERNRRFLNIKDQICLIYYRAPETLLCVLKSDFVLHFSRISRPRHQLCRGMERSNDRIQNIGKIHCR